MYAVLFSDSRLVWFEQKGDRKPKGSVLLKDVIPYICVGLMTDRMPGEKYIFCVVINTIRFLQPRSTETEENNAGNLETQRKRGIFEGISVERS